MLWQGTYAYDDMKNTMIFVSIVENEDHIIQAKPIIDGTTN